MNKFIALIVSGFVSIPPLIQASFIPPVSMDILGAFSIVFAFVLFSTGKVRVNSSFYIVIFLLLFLIIVYSNFMLLSYNLVSVGIGILLVYLSRRNGLRYVMYALAPITLFISVNIIINNSSSFAIQYISTVRLQVIFLLLLIEYSRKLIFGIPVALSLLWLGSRLGNLFGLFFLLFVLRPYLLSMTRGLRIFLQGIFMLLIVPFIVNEILQNVRVLGSINRSFLEEPRVEIYRQAWNNILYSPFYGNGLGSYSMLHSTYPHNFMLQLLEDFGLFGVIPIFVIFWLVLGALKRKVDLRFVALYLLVLVNVSMDFYKFVFFIGLLFYYLFRYGNFRNYSLVWGHK